MMARGIYGVTTILFAIIMPFLLFACQGAAPNNSAAHDFAAALKDNAKLAQVFSEHGQARGVTNAAMFYGARSGQVSAAFIGDNTNHNSLFQAASMSKSVAALGILTLAQREGIDINEDIRPHVTSLDWSKIKGGDKPVTLRGLLSHTAGASVSGFAGYRRGDKLPTSNQIVEGVKPANHPAVHLASKKGRFAYSGGGYQIAQIFAEEVSGKPFAKLMEELVLTPLNMNKSSFSQPINPDDITPLTIAKASSGFRPLAGVFWPARNTWRNYPEQAAAGLWTTPQDYAQFAAMIMRSFNGEPTPFPRDIIMAMLTNVDNNYGLGLLLTHNEEGELTYFEHGGANFGYRCLFRAFPAHGSYVVVMTNTPSGTALADDIIEGATLLAGQN